MIKKIENKNMGRSNLGWLQSIFHFSFAEYYNPKNMNFGSLRVVNDDLVKSNTGFPTHPHKDMEIISYVVKGALTHGDSMGNENTLTRGQVQYMSAGTGVYHSEYNLSDNTLRFLQIWIVPDNTGYKPNYGDYRFTWEERKNKWLHMVSSKSGNAPIKINQDFNIYSIELDINEEIDFPINKGRQAYILQVEGSSSINEILLNERDAAELIEENIYIKAKNTSHILVLEMKKDE